MAKNIGIDPYTGEEFEKRRSNQRFANAKNKSAYHNKKQKEKWAVSGFWWKKVNVNRMILARIIGSDDEKTVSSDYLEGAGFDFRYICASNCNGTSYVIFDFVYSRSQDGLKVIIRRRK